MRIQAYLDQSPLFAVNRAARRFEALAAKALAADELSLLEGLTLTTLFFESPRALKPSELAELFSVSRSAASHTISGLESRGLLRRTIDAEDARAFQLTLTTAGKRAALRAVAAFDHLQAGFEKQLGKQTLRRMLDSLGKIEAIESSR